MKKREGEEDQEADLRETPPRAKAAVDGLLGGTG